VSSVTIKLSSEDLRRCGSCTLCCKLLPQPELHKPSNTRCKHQRHSGCAIYPQRPSACRIWNCRWLVNDDTADLRRPDKSRYVIDIMPDYVEIVENETDARTAIEVVQIWVDPRAPDAWRDQALLDYIDRRGQEGIATIIRWSNIEAMTVFPPSMSTDRQWHEISHGQLRPERTAGERLAGLARARKTSVQFD
jgi:hypothetical protein